MRNAALLRTVCAVVALAAVVTAQQFLEPTHRFLPRDLPLGSVAAAGDLDADGDQDLVVATGTRVQWLANDGTGRFVRRADMSIGTGWITSVLLVDYDGDGDLDVISGHDGYGGAQAQALEAIENLGGFRFRVATAAVLPTLPPRALALAAADVDRDGDLDLIVSNRSDDWLLLNQAGRFADATASHLPNALAGSQAVAAGDVDADGDMDLCFAGFPDRLHLNDGSGRYVLAPAGTIPSGSSEAGWLADFDGDGAFDLLRLQTSSLSVAWNNGGQFANAGPLGAAAYPIVGDLGGPVILYTDPGSGGLGWLKFDRLRQRQQSLWLREPVVPSLLFDSDGDGDQDLLGFGFGDRAFLYTNGGGSLTRAGGHPVHEGWFPTVLAAADLNGDGFDDLIASYRLLFNDGTGVFVGTEFPYPMPSGGNPGGLVAGDVDGDGDIDLVYVWNMFGIAYGWFLALNDGRGRISAQFLDNLPIELFAARSARLADLNGDARMDLVWCSTRGVEYAAGPLPTATRRFVYGPTGSVPRRIVLADVDADGDLDLVVSIEPRGVRLLLNDGAAHFSDVSAQRLPVGSAVIMADAIASGDIDGDGDVDLFVGGLYSQPDVLYVNDGTGTFTDRSNQLPQRTAGSGEGALLDIDGDGDLDIVTRGGEMLRNDGRGVFTLDPQALETAGDSIVSLDADGDGDVDVVLGGTVMVNLHRQLLSPYAPRVGRTFPLEIHARPTGGAGGFAALLLSATRQSPPIPVPGLGLLGLHPWFMVSAGVYPIVPGATRADVSFGVPALPGIVGVDLHGQALVWSGTRLDLTNVVTSTVCY